MGVILGPRGRIRAFGERSEIVLACVYAYISLLQTFVMHCMSEATDDYGQEQTGFGAGRSYGGRL